RAVFFIMADHVGDKSFMYLFRQRFMRLAVKFLQQHFHRVDLSQAHHFFYFVVRNIDTVRIKSFNKSFAHTSFVANRCACHIEYYQLYMRHNFEIRLKITRTEYREPKKNSKSKKTKCGFLRFLLVI